jgi:hypothetical protein
MTTVELALDSVGMIASSKVTHRATRRRLNWHSPDERPDPRP